MFWSNLIFLKPYIYCRPPTKYLKWTHIKVVTCVQFRVKYSKPRFLPNIHLIILLMSCKLFCWFFSPKINLIGCIQFLCQMLSWSVGVGEKIDSCMYHNFLQDGFKNLIPPPPRINIYLFIFYGWVDANEAMSYQFLEKQPRWAESSRKQKSMYVEK